MRENIHIFDTKMMGIDEWSAVYIIPGEKNVIIDAGTRDCAPELISYLKENNLFPHYIIVTHNHYDHIGAIAPLQKEFGEKEIRIISGKTGVERLKDPNEINHLFTDIVFDPIENVTAAGDGEILHLGGTWLKVIYTPGHSEDSISLFDLDRKIVFPGDLPGDWLWGKTYFSTNFSSDFSEEEYFRSTEKLLSLDINSIAMPHYGIFHGEEAYGILRDQLSRYKQWRDILVPAWNLNRDLNDVAVHLKNFFAGSPLEKLEPYDFTLKLLAGWCIMGYRSAGIVS